MEETPSTFEKDSGLSFQEFKNSSNSKPENYATEYAAYLTELSNFRELLEHEKTREQPGAYNYAAWQSVKTDSYIDEPSVNSIEARKQLNLEIIAEHLTGRVSQYLSREKYGFIDRNSIKSEKDPNFKRVFEKNLYFCESDICLKNPAARCASCGENEMIRFDLARNIESKYDFSDDLYAVNITGIDGGCVIGLPELVDNPKVKKLMNRLKKLYV